LARMTVTWTVNSSRTMGSLVRKLSRLAAV